MGSAPGRILRLFKARGLRSLPGSYLSWLARHEDGSELSEDAMSVMDMRDGLGIYDSRKVGWMHPRELRYGRILNCCAKAKALSTGKWLHARIVRKGMDESVFLGNLLVKMYGKCGCVEEAKAVFDGLGTSRIAVSWAHILSAYAQNGHLQEAKAVFEQMPHKDLVAWTGIISAHSEYGYHTEALRLYKGMLCDGMKPDRPAFISVLDACSGLRTLAEGRELHSHILQSRLRWQGYDLSRLRNMLLYMYGLCGSPADAEAVLKSIPLRHRLGKLTKTLMLAAYIENGHYKSAIEIFRSYKMEAPFPITYIIVLVACASARDLRFGSSLHNGMPKIFQAQGKIGSALVNMYSRCGSLENAKACFDKIHRKDIPLPWSAVIAAYAQNGHNKQALELFKTMQLEGATPNSVTFSIAISICSLENLLNEAHQQMISMVEEYKIMPVFEDYMAMVELLASYGEFDVAQELLQNMPFEPPSLEFNLCNVVQHLGVRRQRRSSYLGPKIVEDVYSLLRRKLVVRQTDIETWLDSDIPFELGHVASDEILEQCGIKPVKVCNSDNTKITHIEQVIIPLNFKWKTKASYGNPARKTKSFWET